MTQGLGRLDDFPRAELCRLPTAIEPLRNLSRRIGGSGIWVKRDDQCGPALGGNKARQLEFYLGEARAQAADTILITGAVQSNFVRLAAASARMLGMECHIQLEERVPRSDAAYRNSGNVLLDRILGATIHSYPQGEDEAGADRRLREIASELEDQGRRPYIIPLAPGHKPLGALGYVAAAREVLQQLAEQKISIDEIIVPSGSGNTHAGLLVGLRALGCRVRVTGVCVRRGASEQEERIMARCDEIAELLGIGSPAGRSDMHLMDEVLGPGYGRLNEATLEAIEITARSEGLLVDPVYSGKAMAGCIRRAREARAGRSLLFLHTGGVPAIFAYAEDLSAALGPSGTAGRRGPDEGKSTLGSG